MVIKENKTTRVLKYLSVLTKHGIMRPMDASNLSKRYRKDKNLDEVMEEIIMLPAPEEKEEVLRNVIISMNNDVILHPAKG